MSIVINDAAVRYDVTEIKTPDEWVSFVQKLKFEKHEEVEPTAIPSKYPCLVIADREMVWTDDNGSGSHVDLPCMIFYDYAMQR